MKLNTTFATIALTLGLVSASHAALSLFNGDFETGNDWVSTGTAPDNAPNAWYSNIANTTDDGAYGSTIDSYGTDRVAALKQDLAIENYYSQGIGVLETGDTGIKVEFDGGFRTSDTYSSVARTIDLKVSIWDLGADSEVASKTFSYNYNTTAQALTAESETFFWGTANNGNNLELRFENVSNNAALPTGDSTALIDNVVITATVPEPSSAALLGLGGLALILRRRK